MNNYYTKYLKYKNKYLELKRITEKELVGGVVGESSCILSFFSTSIWNNLQKYNCNYEDIKKKFPNEILKFSYNEFLQSNKGRVDRKIEVSDLKDRGFPADVLKKAGFPLSELNKAGFSLIDLKEAGFSAINLRTLNVSLSDLKEAGFSATDLKNVGFDIYMLMCIFTNDELKEAGFTTNKTNPDRYLEIGRKVCNKINAKVLKDEGYTVDELKDWYLLDNLIEAGFTDDELIKAGFIKAVLDDQKSKIKNQESRMKRISS